MKKIQAPLFLLVLLALVSCGKPGEEPVSGTYGVTTNLTEDINYHVGYGIIFGAMEDAVTEASKGFSVRSEASDNAVKAAADKVYEERKNQSDKDVILTVVFKPGNVSGQPEKTPIPIKSYTFKAVE